MSTEPIDLGIVGLVGLERIGAGGNAVVYRARQPELDRNVVVKVLMAVDAESTRRRFDRERRAMGRLSQTAGIAPVYDSGFTSGGQPYLIMPFYERGSLQELLETSGALTPEEARTMAVRICRAVQTAHENGVVHRDLKPANILMSMSGRPDVADFGIAQLVDDTGGASQALTMTPLYTAPEVFDGVDSGVAIDVYALGALLFALLNGRPAYSDESGRVPMLALIRRVNEDPLPGLPAGTPPDLAAIVATAMQKNPTQRHPSAGAMADALDAADISPVGSKRGRRSYVMLLGAVMVLGAAIAAALVAANLRTGQDDVGDDTPVIPTEPPVGGPSVGPSAGATPATIAFDAEVARSAADRALVRIEAFSCAGVEVADGVVLGDGLIITDDKILRSPWYISVIDGQEAHSAVAVTSDRNHDLGMVQVASSAGLEPPPLASVRDGDRVAIFAGQGAYVEAVLISVDDEPSRLIADGAASDQVGAGAAVITESGNMVGVTVTSGQDVYVLTIERLEQEWTRTPPVQGCATLARDLTADDVDQAISPRIIELLQMQRLSNAYAHEEWETVRELEPGKQDLTDQEFEAGWRPLRQGFVYPVHRGGGELSARWRVGLIGHETWLGSDLTTLFCVTWTVDAVSGEVTQTNEDTVAVYGSQPGQPQREGFVDPGDLRVLIDQNCPLGP